jgi:hypothetical protein
VLFQKSIRSSPRPRPLAACSSFYVGDAAGRKGDFSAADEGFAQVSGPLPFFRNVAHVHSFRLLFEFPREKVRM